MFSFYVLSDNQATEPLVSSLSPINGTYSVYTLVQPFLKIWLDVSAYNLTVISSFPLHVKEIFTAESINYIQGWTLEIYQNMKFVHSLLYFHLTCSISIRALLARWVNLSHSFQLLAWIGLGRTKIYGQNRTRPGTDQQLLRSRFRARYDNICLQGKLILTRHHWGSATHAEFYKFIFEVEFENQCNWSNSMTLFLLLWPFDAIWHSRE